jgi:HK97 family phage major capsid protein
MSISTSGWPRRCRTPSPPRRPRPSCRRRGQQAQGPAGLHRRADAVATWGQVGYLATGVAGGWPATNPTDKLIDLIYAAKTQYRQNGRFVMNRRTVSAVRKFKDAQGNYIWNAALQPGQSATLLGYPVTEIEAMPDVAANSLAIAFGDFEKGYLIVDRAGVRVLRDPYSAKPHVLFYTTKRVGGGVQNFDADQAAEVRGELGRSSP